MRLSLLRTCLVPVVAVTIALPAAAQVSVPCGGSFSGFLQEVRAEALSRGLPEQAVDRFLSGARQDSRTLSRDRSQGIFNLPFTEFAHRVISQNRMDHGRRNAQRYDAIFREAERRFGVSRGVILAFWALETDYGAVQGDFNTRNSLLTLAHDCRRPELFQPQVFAGIALTARGGMDPATTTGAWAGEIGMVQMLPEDILENGIDGDGDGAVRLKSSVPDALLSGAHMLEDLGWRRGEPWLQEVTVPSGMDWRLTGLDQPRRATDWARMGVAPRWGDIRGDLQAALILPQGRGGPVFLAYPNFNVFFEWNQSFVYVTTAAYFATRLEGAPVFDAGNPSPGLSESQMIALQRKLVARGHDVGGVDGILGARTRAAVQAEQARLGLPADAWPTVELLNRL